MHDPYTGDLFPGADLGSSERAGASTVREPRGDWLDHDLLRPRWAPADTILVGTSGFSFADWVGPFYPDGFRFGDMLPYYSRQFAVVEVNSTYYRVPPPRTFEQMAGRTPAGFRFVIKLHQVITHERRLDPRVCDDLEAGLEPLVAAGKLDGLLAQFPFSFKRERAHRRHLEALRRRFPDLPIFVEFRHASWARPETWRFLRETGLGFSIVDEPDLPGLMPPIVELTSELGYLRLHGRNARHWWGHNGPDRYDYRYTPVELGDWIPRLRELAGRAEKVYVFFNNCHAGQAAQNAQLMQELLASVA